MIGPVFWAGSIIKKMLKKYLKKVNNYNYNF